MTEYTEVRKAVAPDLEPLDALFRRPGGHGEERLSGEAQLQAHLRDNGWEDRGDHDCTMYDIWWHPVHGSMPGYEAAVASGWTQKPSITEMLDEILARGDG
jgi:hypothetical protein